MTAYDRATDPLMTSFEADLDALVAEDVASARFARAARRLAALTPDDALALACASPVPVDGPHLETELAVSSFLGPADARVEDAANRALVIASPVLSEALDPDTDAFRLAWSLVMRAMLALAQPPGFDVDQWPANSTDDLVTRAIVDPFEAALGLEARP